MKTFLIVDGSSVFYRAFYAMPKLTTPGGEPTGALVGFANIILKLLRERKPDFVAIALDKAKKTFRNELFTDYKAKRPPMPDELSAQFPLLKEFSEVLGLKTCAAEGYEADDIIGTLATQACKDFSVEILTGDRDALQLINSTTRVLLYKNSVIHVYDEKKFYDEYSFAPPLLVDYKALCGDQSDNIPGVKSIGSKTATPLIQTYGTLERIFANYGEISNGKVRNALRTYIDDAKLYKKLAQIVCDVPEITFAAQDFEIHPDFARADDFCDRYALTRAKKKIHNLFGVPETDLFSEPIEIFNAPEAQPNDFEKIFAADSLILALRKNIFAVKIFGGEIFSVTADGMQRIFDEFGGKIILSDAKNFLHRFSVKLNKIFDAELAAYLICPERGKSVRDEDLGIGKDLTTHFNALEKFAPLYEKNLLDMNLTRLYSEIEMPLTEILARMEERGVFVNKSQIKEKSAVMSEKIAVLEKNIYELAGETFNVNSPKQFAEVLFEKLKLPAAKKTKTGYSTNAEALEEIKNLHPVVDAILEFRALTKLKSTYLDGLAKLLDRNDRVHTNFNQTVTATGRLSSSDPNLQNIPVRTEEGRAIRALFEPGEGYDCILSADYSQIELRLLAHMSGDKNLIDAFKCGQDIHARTAAEVFGVPVEDVTPDLRRKAKAVNFGIVYGISAYGLARDLHISREEAGEYIKKYFERYPDVKDFLDATVAQAHLHGYVTTIFGRRRALDDINSINFSKRTLAERMAMNTPIQGSAADIIKLAMIRAEENLRGLESRIILQVHDELVLEAKNSELAEAEKILRDAMENVTELAVPLIVDVHSGANWALAK